MNKIFKSAILGLAIMMSVNFASAQNNNDLIGSWENVDFAWCFFHDMGNLPTIGTVTATWVHPTYTNVKTFGYVGDGPYIGDNAPNNQVSITVRVNLGAWMAQKTQSGNQTTFHFYGNDFVEIWKEETNTQTPNTTE